MHTPEHNPFVTELGPIEYSFSPGLQDYLLEIGSSMNPDTFSDYFTSDFDYPGYSYQGINQDIMGALTNVFGPEAIGDFAMQSAQDLQGIVDNVLVLIGADSPYVDFDASDMNIADFLQAESGGIPIDDISNVFTANIFDPDSIASVMNTLTDGADFSGREVKALTPEMLEKTTSEYYSPYEEAERGKAIDTLGTRIGGVSTGGFAGSGGRQAGLSGAESLYRDDYKDIIANIQKLRGGATTDVLDTIYAWQEQMADWEE